MLFTLLLEVGTPYMYIPVHLMYMLHIHVHVLCTNTSYMYIIHLHYMIEVERCQIVNFLSDEVCKQLLETFTPADWSCFSDVRV